MLFDALEQELYSTWYNGEFESKYQRLGRFLRAATGAERGRALGLLAYLGYFEDFHNLPRAISLVDEALPLLVDHPVFSVKCLLDAIAYARKAGDAARADHYAKRLRAQFGARPDDAELAKWEGSALLALARYQEDSGSLVEALELFRESVRVNQRGIGPHGGVDNIRRLQMSHVGCCEMLVRLGRLDEAVAQLDLAQRVAWDKSTLTYAGAALREARVGAVIFAEALVACANGDAAGAGVMIDGLLADPRLQWDHALRFRSLELKAHIIAEVGGSGHQVYLTLIPVMEQLDAVGNTRGLIRLQRLVKSLLAG